MSRHWALAVSSGYVLVAGNSNDHFLPVQNCFHLALNYIGKKYKNNMFVKNVCIQESRLCFWEMDLALSFNNRRLQKMQLFTRWQISLGLELYLILRSSHNSLTTHTQTSSNAACNTFKMFNRCTCTF